MSRTEMQDVDALAVEEHLHPVVESENRESFERVGPLPV